MYTQTHLIATHIHKIFRMEHALINPKQAHGCYTIIIFSGVVGGGGGRGWSSRKDAAPV